MKTIKITTTLVLTLLAATILVACSSNESGTLQYSGILTPVMAQPDEADEPNDVDDAIGDAADNPDEQEDIEDVQIDIPRRDQVLDFRHWENLSEEVKEWLQELLNSYGNPTEGDTDIIGFEAAYRMVEKESTDGKLELIPDGGLYHVAFIRNGKDEPIDISRIKLTIFVDEEVIENGESRMERIVVAVAYFNVNVGTIMPSQSIIFQFTFNDEHVMVKDANLSHWYTNWELWY